MGFFASCREGMAPGVVHVLVRVSRYPSVIPRGWVGTERTQRVVSTPAHPILHSVSGAALERQLVALHRVGLPGGASGHVRPPSTPSERGVESGIGKASCT